MRPRKQTKHMSKQERVHELIIAAIQQRRLVRLQYKSRERIVEPHDYEIKYGTSKLLAYQVGGSSTHKLPNWRWLELNQISELELLDQPSRAGAARLQENTTNGTHSSSE